MDVGDKPGIFFCSVSEACIDSLSQQDIVFPGPDELCARLLATREISEEDGKAVINYHMLLS